MIMAVWQFHSTQMALHLSMSLAKISNLRVFQHLQWHLFFSLSYKWDVGMVDDYVIIRVMASKLSSSIKVNPV